MGELICEFWNFMKARKTFWLLPIIVVLFILSGVIFLTSGTAVAPFIYTLF
jgi:competence protein ComGC